MTTLTDQLLGARVKSADGQAVGTVEKVFGDNGKPTWAWVRTGTAGRFVPLGHSRVTRNGLKIPYDRQQIKDGPNLTAGLRISAGQARELGRYYGLPVLPQQAKSPRQAKSPHRAAPARPASRSRASRTHEKSLVRHEEQIQLDKEMLEAGRVRLHRYVDVEPVEQVVHLVHEEYEVERMPASGTEDTHELSEAEREITLHQERPVLRKRLVPVERVRLTVKEVEEDLPVGGEVRRERIEIEPERRARNGRIRQRTR
jgi:stress response protein YsnF